MTTEQLIDEAKRLERRWFELAEATTAAKRVYDQADDLSSRAWGEWVFVDKLKREAIEAEDCASAPLR